jgi:methyl-accepting chemotaxis protein/methyl-accepting chemotaxis protein-1 (serine sensor receptor)
MQSSAVTKLVAGAATMVALSIAVGGSSLVINQRLSRQLDRAVGEIARRQILAGQISTGAADLVAQERGLAFAAMLQQSDQVENAKSAYGQADERLQKHFQELTGLLTGSALRGDLDRLSSDFQEARGQHAEMISLLQQQKMDVAIGMLNSRLIPKLSQVSEAAKKLVERETVELSRVRASAETEQAVSYWVLIGLNLLGFCAGGALILLVHRFKISLRSAVTNLTQGSGQLAAAAAQVSQASLSLSQVASEQAASLEQTSASTEEIHSMTRRNAENAKGAAQRTQEAYQTIQEANKSLEQMVASMQQITESSGKISKIIKVIDEIAFQTNILALNAAVEAARAGEAGMGFAVVADEVRNLAQRSAAAAKDTAGLIEESITRAEEGRNRMHEVARAITSITESSQRVKTLVDEVREGSQQQENGIDQIARTVSHLDQVTQKVAANAEEGAAAGSQLTAQSQAVDKVVRTLQQLVGAGAVEDSLPRPAAAQRRVSAVAPLPAAKAAAKPAKSAAAPPVKPVPVAAGPLRPEDLIPLDDDFKNF